MDGVISCPLLPNELEIPDVSFGTLLFDGIRNHSAPALVGYVFYTFNNAIGYFVDIAY